MQMSNLYVGMSCTISFWCPNLTLLQREIRVTEGINLHRIAHLEWFREWNGGKKVGLNHPLTKLSGGNALVSLTDLKKTQGTLVLFK